MARAAARYRPGKAPANAQDTYSSDESEGGGDDNDGGHQPARGARKRAHDEEQWDEPIRDLSSGAAALKNNKRRTAGVVVESAPLRKPVVKLSKVSVGRQDEAQQQQRQVDDDGGSDEYETDTDGEEEHAAPPPKPVFRKPGAVGAPATGSTQKVESSEYETDSDDDDEQESEEDSRPKLLKPMFVSRRQRDTLRATEDIDAPTVSTDADDGIAAEERRKQSHLLAAETIKRELAEKEHEEAQPDLSDTDGRDPEEEFSAWRIRELSRLKADRESAAEKEAERAEIERRRSMPEAQRLAEDMERARKSREEKKQNREPGAFLQKYHHKGSFFQDMDILKKDYSGKTENQVDMSLLPSVMQVRDYGKAGRSKWTHLANEDTSRQQHDHRLKGIEGVGAGAGGRQGGMPSGQQCFACGGPHLRRDCPQATGQQAGRGANSIPVRARRDGER